MAEQHKKADGTQTVNGDIPVVAPMNMGNTLMFKDKVYNVNIGDTLIVGEDGLFGYTVNWDILANP